MNRKEWKEYCKVDKARAHRWYNKVRKFLKSKEFELLENCDKDAKVIHHLRDTEEQRKYNDKHYEMFGFEVDENGNESFTYGKYVVFWTKEHHSEYHKCSEETRKKIGESNKGRVISYEVRKKISESSKGKHSFTEEQIEQIRNSVHEYYKQEGSREKTSKATKEAMQRPEIRQRLIEGCKKRPPLSKEARVKAAESNRVKPMSELDSIILYDYFKCTVGSNRSLSVKELSELYHKYNHSIISWNTFQKAFSTFRHMLSLGF